VCTTAISAPHPLLTAEESSWVKSHPIIRIAIDPEWKPLEYAEDGVVKGLSAAYLKKIEEYSGLKFELIETHSWTESIQAVVSHKADLLPAVNTPDFQTLPDTNGQLLYSPPYYVGPTIIVSRSDTSNIFNTNDFVDMTIAIKGGGALETWLRAHQSNAKILTFRNYDSALSAVATGRAQVAIGAKVIIHPLLYQRYNSELNLAGAIPELPVILSMATRSDWPVLRTIIEKGLKNLSSGETALIYQQWLETADYGRPNLAALIKYYRSQIYFGVIAFAVLLFGIHQARIARRVAEENAQQKSMFLAVMSHEIRTPINAVLSSIELLHHSPLNENQRKLVGIANNSTETLLRLLNDVLDYSKFITGSVVLERIPGDILQIAREALDAMEISAKEKGISLVLDVDKDIPALIIDSTRIRQILSNILSNAVKFTERGEVKLILSLRENVTGAAQYLLGISVIDTGIGISIDGQRALFKPFSQAELSITRRYGGSGLGLAICREIVEKMEGHIELKSSPGIGTTISITVPVDIATHFIAKGQAQNNILSKQMDILADLLVVEDIIAGQFLIKQQLSLLGYSCDIAQNGDTAIAKFSKKKYDAILMDCHLPGISGYRVAEKIREIELKHHLNHTPIIAISANSNSDHLEKCLDSGIDNSLSKPIGLERLRETLALWIPSASQYDATHQSETLNSDDFEAEASKSLIEDFESAKQAIQNNDFIRCSELTHRLRGMALMLGELELEKEIELLEEILYDDSSQSQLLIQIRKIYIAMERHLHLP